MLTHLIPVLCLRNNWDVTQWNEFGKKKCIESDLLTHHHDETRNTELHEYGSPWVRVLKVRLLAQTSALRGEWWAIFISGESANNSQRLRIWVSSKVAQHKVTISSRYRILTIQFSVRCLKQPSYVNFHWWWKLKDTARLLMSYITQTWLASWLFISSLSTVTQYRGILSGEYEVLTDLIMGGSISSKMWLRTVWPICTNDLEDRVYQSARSRRRKHCS